MNTSTSRIPILILSLFAASLFGCRATKTRTFHDDRRRHDHQFTNHSRKTFRSAVPQRRRARRLGRPQLG